MSSKVYVKGKNGKTYVYENESYWYKETKKVKHKRKCIGHLENGKIVSNHKRKSIVVKCPNCGEEVEVKL